jgi:hypothetical protein
MHGRAIMWYDAEDQCGGPLPGNHEGRKAVRMALKRERERRRDGEKNRSVGISCSRGRRMSARMHGSPLGASLGGEGGSSWTVTHLGTRTLVERQLARGGQFPLHGPKRDCGRLFVQPIRLYRCRSVVREREIDKQSCCRVPRCGHGRPC